MNYQNPFRQLAVFHSVSWRLFNPAIGAFLFRLLAVNVAVYEKCFRKRSPRCAFIQIHRAKEGRQMKIVAVFFAALILGLSHVLSAEFIPEGLSKYLLYLLMFLVGLGVGSSDNLSSMFKGISPISFLLPLCTIAGSFSMTILIWPLLNGVSLFDSLAISSGFGYYSLSSVMITELKTPLIGATAAAELGAMALLANIFRELMALSLSPFLYRRFGPFAPIAAAGVTSYDVMMPTIVRLCGKQYVPLTILNGFCLDLLVPVLVLFFAS